MSDTVSFSFSVTNDLARENVPGLITEAARIIELQGIPGPYTAIITVTAQPALPEPEIKGVIDQDGAHPYPGSNHIVFAGLSYRDAVKHLAGEHGESPMTVGTRDEIIRLHWQAHQRDLP